MNILPFLTQYIVDNPSQTLEFCNIVNTNNNGDDEDNNMAVCSCCFIKSVVKIVRKLKYLKSCSCFFYLLWFCYDNILLCTYCKYEAHLFCKPRIQFVPLLYINKLCWLKIAQSHATLSRLDAEKQRHSGRKLRSSQPCTVHVTCLCIQQSSPD